MESSPCSYLLSSSGTASSFSGVSEDETNGTRLARLIFDEGTHALRRVLSSMYSSRALENVLKKHLAFLQNLKKKHVIIDDQWKKLFPTTGDPPNIGEFDITLLHLLIRNFSHLPPPATGWNEMLYDEDKQILLGSNASEMSFVIDFPSASPKVNSKTNGPNYHRV